MLFLDRADRVFIERRTAESDTRRGAIPIQQARPIAWAIGVHQEGVFKPASIPGET
jgi:hypothetical protein